MWQLLVAASNDSQISLHAINLCFSPLFPSPLVVLLISWNFHWLFCHHTMFDCWYLQSSCCIHVWPIISCWGGFSMELHIFLFSISKQSIIALEVTVDKHSPSLQISTILGWTVSSTMEVQGDVPSIWHWWLSIDNWYSCALLGHHFHTHMGDNWCHDDDNYLPDILQGCFHGQRSCHHQYHQWHWPHWLHSP